MRLELKLSSLATLVFVAVFYWFFMFTKHDPSLSAILPFGDDPYDAVGSFCLILAVLLTVFSLIRAFRPYRPSGPAKLDITFLARTQVAIPIGVLITLVSNGIAMVRHISAWTGRPGTEELLVLLSGMLVLSLVLICLLRIAARRMQLPLVPGRWRRAWTVSACCAFILAVFPEEMVRAAFGHFVTIVVSFALIAAPQAAFAEAFLPIDPTLLPPATSAAVPRRRTWIQWAVVAVTGLAVGAFALIGELFGEGHADAPLAQLFLVSAIFLGAGMSSLLVAFAFFGRPLGLFRRNETT